LALNATQSDSEEIFCQQKQVKALTIWTISNSLTLCWTAWKLNNIF